MSLRVIALVTVVGSMLACAPDAGDAPLDLLSNDAVTVDTSTAAARAQYDANVSFAMAYRPRCVPRSGHLRVLVTGFGRFLDNPVNATGRIVSTLVPGVPYPLTRRPPPGQVDPPGPQTSVGSATLRLPRAGSVEVCAMIVPVHWDLAAILILKEIEAFAPDFVLMNGIAGGTQPLWIELGSVNQAMTLRDGSDVLVPVAPPGQRFAPIVPGASATDAARGLLLSWDVVRDAAREVIALRGGVFEADRRFDAVVQGVRLAGYPRGGNTYLCNNVTYAVNYAMAYPGRTLTLLQASVPRRGAVNRVTVRLSRDHRSTPRVFVHWPSRIEGEHLTAAAEVMAAILDAQLVANREGPRPTLGSNVQAEIAPSGGETF
jgi:pyrrolidone-carboxylate peptidase